MINQQLAELFTNEDFIEAAKACETVEGVLELVKSKGIEATRDEFDSLMNTVAGYMQSSDSELDEGELEEVSGGNIGTVIAIIGLLIEGGKVFKWWLYDRPYQKGREAAARKNNQWKNKHC